MNNKMTIPERFAWILVGMLVAWLVMAFLDTKACHAKETPYTKENAIKAIIGEAESEGLDGMLAVGCAIRARHSLKGVYGVNAPRVVKRKYSKETYKKAVMAWENTNDMEYCQSLGMPTGWGNKSDVAIFKRQRWFEACTITAQVGRHYFYKCDK